MKLLTEYSSNTNSQFGEDGIIYECLRRMGLLKNGSAVEVGASDGRECSNTLYLRDVQGWTRVLIEADDILFGQIEDHPSDHRIHAALEATGSCSLDALLEGVSVNFLSLDIDGNEYEILDKCHIRLSLLCVEFNPTIPWQFDITSPALGASLSALCRLMPTKGYVFLGATHCNAFFVGRYWENKFEDIDKDPRHYLSEENLTYLITDPYGGAFALGPQIFGAKKRFAGELSIIDARGKEHIVRLSHRSLRPS